jgi:hypothetical protein
LIENEFFFPGYMAKAGSQYWREGTLATGAPTGDFCYELNKGIDDEK